MSRVLLTATPLLGHVQPMVTVGRALLEHGHTVAILTGERYRDLVEQHGLELVPLPPAADITRGAGDRATSDGRPRRRGRAGGACTAIVRTFVAPLQAQYAALTDALTHGGHDVVVSDTAYLGSLPLLLTRARADRVPVLGVSATPLSIVSRDCAPFGTGMQPGAGGFTRMRNAQIHWLLQHGPLRPLNDALDAALQPYGVAPGTVNYLDHVAHFDVAFHLAVAEMEYPRRELPDSIRFVGPLPAGAPSGAALPTWWPDLHGRRPVVHVTQGTVDNHDPGKLLAPVVRALAREPVLTVVTTGGRPVADLRRALGGTLPGNTRVAEFLPYDRLLPLTSAMVSNGGFGGVQQALRHGVPLVVAGDTEDKPEVAARVTYVRAGINLRTGAPRPARVRRAVRDVIGDPSYRAHAQQVSRRIAETGDAAHSIADAVDALLLAPGRARPA
jgi:MGT family glycosyltransferase